MHLRHLFFKQLRYCFLFPWAKLHHTANLHPEYTLGNSGIQCFSGSSHLFAQVYLILHSLFAEYGSFQQDLGCAICCFYCSILLYCSIGKCSCANALLWLHGCSLAWASTGSFQDVLPNLRFAQPSFLPSLLICFAQPIMIWLFHLTWNDTDNFFLVVC